MSYNFQLSVELLQKDVQEIQEILHGVWKFTLNDRIFEITFDWGST